MNKVLSILLILTAVVFLGAQQPYISYSGSGAPTGSCVARSFYIDTDNGWVWTCPNGSWVHNGGVSSPVPSGAILLIDSGSCPSTYTQLTALNGRTIIGTLAANMDVGSTGGSDTITPQGINAAITAGTPAGTVQQATFTGSALATHQHELPLQLGASARVTAGYGTGASIAGVRALTNTASTTAAAVALSQAVTAGTPAGTINPQAFTGSALGTHTHTFTGTQFDNRSLYVRLIGCKKD